MAQAGEDERRRLAFRRGYQTQIQTSALGDPRFGSGAVSTAAGGAAPTSTTLGVA